MKKTSTRLADGRELIYYDRRDDTVRDAVDRRPLDRTVATTSEIRATTRCSATPSPSPPTGRAAPTTRRPTSARCAPRRATGSARSRTRRLRRRRLREPLPLPGRRPGRCEVVCFTSDHDASFADLTAEQARPGPGRVDRPHRRAVRSCPPSSRSSASRTAARRSVSPSATRTARSTRYPFVTPRTALMLRSLAAHTRGAPAAATSSTTSLAGELADGTRVVAGDRALGRLRAVRRPLAVRGAPLPAPPGAGPARPRRGRRAQSSRRSIWNS